MQVQNAVVGEDGTAKCTFLPSRANRPAGSLAVLQDLGGQPYNVSYDGRAFKLNGARTLFLSGTMHYPRAAGPETWESWFRLARQSSLNMLETYAFWNFHEPLEASYNFGGNANLSDFVRRAGDHGLFVNLRIG